MATLGSNLPKLRMHFSFLYNNMACSAQLVGDLVNEDFLLCGDIIVCTSKYHTSASVYTMESFHVFSVGLLSLFPSYLY